MIVLAIGHPRCRREAHFAPVRTIKATLNCRSHGLIWIKNRRESGRYMKALAFDWSGMPGYGSAMTGSLSGSLSPAPRTGHHTAAATAPLILAAPFGRSHAGGAVPLLSAVEAKRLMQIATTVHFPKGAPLYEEGERAEYVYNLIEGEVKTFSLLSSGHYRIVAFLRAGDLVGLAENGGYISSAQAITRVTANRLPLKSLEQLLRRDADLLYHLLCKLCHDLRTAQFHTAILSRHDADGKVAMFLRERRFMVAAAQASISTFVPMTRSDIAAYLGLSLEAVSRSFRHLERKGIIKLSDLHHVDILDPARLEAIALGM